MKSGEKFLKHFDSYFSREEIESITVYSYTHSNPLQFDNVNNFVYHWVQLRQLGEDDEDA
jgi:hypothetical protein